MALFTGAPLSPQARGSWPDCWRYTVSNLHALLADNLLPEPAAGGRLRARAVGIGASVYYPLEVPSTIEECFDQILATAAAIRDPFEQAFIAMVQLPYLQPFEDVNKRMSRLAANIPLVQHNLGSLSFLSLAIGRASRCWPRPSSRACTKATSRHRLSPAEFAAWQKTWR